MRELKQACFPGEQGCDEEGGKVDVDQNAYTLFVSSFIVLFFHIISVKSVRLQPNLSAPTP